MFLRIFESDLDVVDARWRDLYAPDDVGVGFALRCDHQVLVTGLLSALRAERQSRRSAERRLRFCRLVAAGDPRLPIGENGEQGPLAAV